MAENQALVPLQVMINAAAAKYVSGVAVHWYTDWFTPPLTLDLTHSRHPQLFILYTEACTGKATVLSGSMILLTKL